MRAILFVDVQRDFMDADGALPVPGADRIRGKLAEIRRFAIENKILAVMTQDEHDGTEPEMQAQGGPFPPHCMKGTPGQENIPEVPIFEHMSNPYVVAKGFTKRCYDVFDPVLGNKNIEGWLMKNGIDKVYVVGVVGNICVEAAAIGMAKRGIDVTIWDDAVVFMDLDENNNEARSRERMAAAGVWFGLFDAMKGDL